jgi:hypothetical protein
VISPIKLDFWSGNCQEPLMVMKSNHEGTLQCSVFGHSVGLLFYTSSSGKDTLYDIVLFQSAISLVSSSNTWYLREGERNQMRIFVKFWSWMHQEVLPSDDRGQRPPELLWLNEQNY